MGSQETWQVRRDNTRVIGGFEAWEADKVTDDKGVTNWMESPGK